LLTVTPSQHSIVSNQNFIVATRDAGYRNLATALAELLDNGIQAGATNLRIFLDLNPSSPHIAVLDNGTGMEPDVLRKALQFGGSTRFNDRTGPGRFGMGLPNSSLSQARRVEVFTWKNQRRIFFSYLDMDEVVLRRLHEIPKPKNRPLPAFAANHANNSGSLVVWRNCDRIPTRDEATLLDHLHANIGRMYRHYIWNGITMSINDQKISSIDPLLLNSRAKCSGAAEFGQPLLYRMKVPGRSEREAEIRVRFSELPISKWHDLPQQEKRLRTITRNPGVSVVRGKREIAFGWFFMGSKRKENYDDWWRCEITFDPELDEFFGVTNTKQQISPLPELQEALSRDLEQIARTLNTRVRSTFNTLGRDSKAIRTADRRERLLPPPTTKCHSRSQSIEHNRYSSGTLRYKIESVASGDEAFYSFRLSGQRLTLFLNTDHPFYRRVFRPDCRNPAQQRYHWECLLLALARAEAESKSEQEIDYCRRKRIRWSNALATFLGN
jgi:hypothetical protein